MPEFESADISFARWSELADRVTLEPQLDAIFFEASLTRSFADEAARAAFRERWLGRFLSSDPQLAHVALGLDAAGRRTVLGYLVGALDDPGLAPRFGDIGYFASLAELTAQFPAHLHINLAPAARGLGIGRRLVERFAGDVGRAGLPGFHVVTGAHSRNVSFYRRAGLDLVHPFSWSGTDLVLLGRRL